MNRKASGVWMVRGVTLVVVLGLGGWSQAAWSQPFEDELDGVEDGEANAAVVAWIQEFVVPERELAASELAGFGEYVPLGTQCPTVPAASTYATGRPQVDVIVYGMRKACRWTGVWWVCSNQGLGACVFNWSSSGGVCHIGTAYRNYSSGSSNPFGIRGDPVGAGYSDEIYPASHCSSSAIACDNVAGIQYYVSMVDVPSDAQWEICGDDCSISTGSGDLIYGWSNRDIIFAGGGWDEVYGGEGSDCIFGDDHPDSIHGEGCASGDDEYLWGLNGDDVIDVTSGTCTRYITGGAGWDSLTGGKGDDYIQGDTEDDSLSGGPLGFDVCSGGQHVYGDVCDVASCDTLLSCNP